MIRDIDKKNISYLLLMIYHFPDQLFYTVYRLDARLRGHDRIGEMETQNRLSYPRRRVSRGRFT